MPSLVCSICREVVTSENSNAFALGCGHIFHIICVTTWLKKSRSCPSCRTVCNPEACRRLYFEFESDDNYDAPTPPPPGAYDALYNESLAKDQTIMALQEEVMVLKDAARIMGENILAKDGQINNMSQIIIKQKHDLDDVITSKNNHKLAYQRASHSNMCLHTINNELQQEVMNLTLVKRILDHGDPCDDTAYLDKPALQSIVCAFKRDLLRIRQSEENLKEQLGNLSEDASSLGRENHDLKVQLAHLRAQEHFKRTFSNDSNETAIDRNETVVSQSEDEDDDEDEFEGEDEGQGASNSREIEVIPVDSSDESSNERAPAPKATNPSGPLMMNININFNPLNDQPEVAITGASHASVTYNSSIYQGGKANVKRCYSQIPNVHDNLGRGHSNNRPGQRSESLKSFKIVTNKRQYK